jgi:signal transduction histidine kinase
MNIDSDIFIDLNDIINNTIEGILIIEDGFIKNLNKPLLDILGYENKNEIIGNLATGILIPTSNDKFIKFNSQLFQELSIITKNGEIIPTIIKIKDINYHNNEYKMVSILDLREVKEKENIFLHQSKHAAMGEMISMIAHQWRQPLTFISTIITRLKFKNNTNNLDKNLLNEKFEEIDNHIQYMSNTIDDFRNFFKQDKQKTLISLDEIIIIVKNMILDSFQLENIQIIVENKKLNKLNIFKNDVIQVVLNILNNAKDAFISKNIKNPIINIYFAENDKEQFIYIQDNAGGIDEFYINNIFVPYFSTKNEKNGTGLGLYICKTIVEKNLNGKINVENKNDGVLFTIKLTK